MDSKPRATTDALSDLKDLWQLKPRIDLRFEAGRTCNRLLHRVSQPVTCEVHIVMSFDASFARCLEEVDLPTYALLGS